MKAISLLQPWASLVVIGAKTLETRSRKTNYRGRILVHASAKEFKPVKGMEILLEHMTAIGFWDKVKHMQYGAIIGAVDIIDCCDTETWNAFPNTTTHSLTDQERAFGDYSAGRFVYTLSNPVMFDKTYPAKGSVTIPWECSLPINIQ